MAFTLCLLFVKLKRVYGYVNCIALFNINFKSEHTDCLKAMQISKRLLPVTSMVNEHTAPFPLGSRASQITLVCPNPNWLPDFKLQVTVGVTPELSFACGSVQTATAVDSLGTVAFVWFAGQEINAGSSVSRIYYRIQTSKWNVLILRY